MSPTVVSLCDLTGHMVQPWVDAGYHAVLIDPQHGTSIHKAPPGPDRENFRSATPLGFARAVFAANANDRRTA